MKLCFSPILGAFEWIELYPDGSTRWIDMSGLDAPALRAALPAMFESLYGVTLSVWTTRGDALHVLDALEMPYAIPPALPIGDDALDALARYAMTHSRIVDRPWRPKWHRRETNDQAATAIAIDPQGVSDVQAPAEPEEWQGRHGERSKTKAKTGPKPKGKK